MPLAPEVADQVWVTLATNDSYALGALVLGLSLRRAGTKRTTLVMVTPQVSASMRQILGDVFNEVQEVNVLDSNDASNLALIERPNLGVTFTKLHCWRLTQFTKGVFLDADTMLMQNCDELFGREELSAAPDCGWPDCFNSGVFVFSPSEDTYQSLLNFAVTYGSFDGGDQGLLNLYFADWAHKDIKKHLPFVYNMVSTATYSYLPAVKQFGKDVKIVHFLGSTKPWMHQYDPASGNVTVFGGPAHQHVQGYLKQWWDLFAQTVLPKMTGDYGLVDNFDFMAVLRRILPSCMMYNAEAEQAYHDALGQQVPEEAAGAGPDGDSNALFMESFQPDSYVWHEFIPQSSGQQHQEQRPPSPEPPHFHGGEQRHEESEQQQRFPWEEFKHERIVPEYILERQQEEQQHGHSHPPPPETHHEQHHAHDHEHQHQHQHHEPQDYPHHEPWQEYGIPKPQDSFSYGQSLPAPPPPPPPPSEPEYHAHPPQDHNQYHPPPQPAQQFFQPHHHEQQHHHHEQQHHHHDHGHHIHQHHSHGHGHGHVHGNGHGHGHGHDHPHCKQYPSWGPVWERFPVGGPNLPVPIYQADNEDRAPTREQFERSDSRRPMIWHVHPVGGPHMPLEKRIARQFKKSKSRLEAEKRRVAENQRRRQMEAETQELKSVETLKKENLMGLKFTKIKRLPSRPEPDQDALVSKRVSPVSGATSSDDSGFAGQHQEKHTSPPPQFTPPANLLSMCTGMFRGKRVKLINGTPTIVPANRVTADPISMEEKVLIKHKVRSSRVPIVGFSRGVQTELSLLEDLIPALMTSSGLGDMEEDPTKRNLGPALDAISKEEQEEEEEERNQEATPSSSPGPVLETELGEQIVPPGIGAITGGTQQPPWGQTKTATYVPSDYVPMSSSSLVSMLKDKAAGLVTAMVLPPSPPPAPAMDVLPPPADAATAGMNQRKPTPMQSY